MIRQITGFSPTINSNSYGNKNVSFKRALTIPERSELQAATKTAMKVLGIDKNVMVIHSPSLPSDVSHELNRNINIGLGSSAGYRIRKVGQFARDLFGSDALQIGPETILSKYNKYSPYSNGAFVQGEHLLSPLRLFHNGILKKSDIAEFATERPFGNTKIAQTNYQKCFDSNEKILRKAFANFKHSKKVNKNIKLNFENFKLDPTTKPWLHKNAVFHSALMKEYNNENIFAWDDIDRKLNLYLEDKTLGKYEDAKRRLDFLEKKYKNDIERFEFGQFLIHDAKVESKMALAKERIMLIGDIKIGNGWEDLWAFPKAFIADLDKRTCSMVGFRKNQDWGVMALNPNAKEAHEFLRLKANQTLQYTTGTRLDAAFGYVQPFLTQKVYSPEKGFTAIESKQVKQGDSLLKTLKSVFEERKIPSKYILAENIGPYDQIGETAKVLKSLGINEATYDNPALEFMHQNRRNLPDSLTHLPTAEQRASFDSKWFVASNHDTDTLINRTNNDRQLQKHILANDFIGSSQPPSEKGWKREFSYADAFGISERYNNPEMPEKSWTSRLPDNFEEYYYQNLAENNQGYNFPEILLDAVEKKGVRNEIPKVTLDALEKYRQLLKEKGPYSTYEVEQKYIKGPEVLKPPKVTISKAEVLMSGLTAISSIPLLKEIFGKKQSGTN